MWMIQAGADPKLVQARSRHSIGRCIHVRVVDQFPAGSSPGSPDWYVADLHGKEYKVRPDTTRELNCREHHPLR
jgi:hypothetical protein